MRKQVLIARHGRAAMLATVLVLSAGCSGADDDAADVNTTAVAAGSTAPPTSAPSTTSPPTTVAPASTAATNPLGEPPSQALTGGSVEVPAVEGFSYGVEPDVPVPWVQLDLPADAEAAAFALREAGGPIGSLIVADGFSHTRYLDELFDQPVPLVRNFSDAGTVTLETPARWQVLSGVPLVAATSPEAFFNQWVWQHDGTTWIAVGTVAVERWVTGMLAVQVPTPNPYDYSTVGGTLYEALPVVHPYTYVDAPVADIITHQEQTIAGGCGRRLFLGRIVPVDDPDPINPDPADLTLVASTIAGACAADGWFEDLDATLTSLGFQPDAIGEVPVQRRDTSLVFVDGNDVYEFASADPATLAAMAPFIDAFVTGELPPDVTDNTTLAVGTCLYRAPSTTGDEANRRTFAVQCTEPHQGEVYHRFEINIPAGQAFPGDAEAQRLGDQGCLNSFTSYVGVPYDASRLDYLYYYPTQESWNAGDRAVMCIAFGVNDELFRRSFSGIAL